MSDVKGLFETPIWGYVLNNEQYHKENYIEYLLKLKESEPSAQKSNFGGYQTNDNLHKVGVFKEFVTVLEGLANDIFKEFSNEKLEIVDMWGNINNRKDSNAAHTHGGILSGVVYLQVPEDSGRLILINPAVRSNAHAISIKNYPIQPQDLGCIMFPSWLEHYVEPSNSDIDRISISFNFDKVK